jgi:hypothetical protein
MEGFKIVIYWMDNISGNIHKGNPWVNRKIKSYSQYLEKEELNKWHNNSMKKNETIDKLVNLVYISPLNLRSAVQLICSYKKHNNNIQHLQNFT